MYEKNEKSPQFDGLKKNVGRFQNVIIREKRKSIQSGTVKKARNVRDKTMDYVFFEEGEGVFFSEAISLGREQVPSSKKL